MICRIINVEVRVISPAIDTETLIILHISDITKTKSNNCFIIDFKPKITNMAGKTIKIDQHADNSVVC